MKDEIKKIVELARLELEEEEEIIAQVEKILGYVSQLEEVDIEGVPPTSWTLGEVQRFREDKPEHFQEPGKILELAPEKKEEYFAVPKVVEK